MTLTGRLVACGCLCAAAVGVASLASGRAPDVRGYRSWTKVNLQPIYMEPYVAQLCVMPPPYLCSPNPHVPRYFTVFVNEVGKKAMMAKGATHFPVGSVIVKEKFTPSAPFKGDYDVAKTKPKSFEKPELLTIMVKRERGFNPECGDWEFHCATGDAKIVRGTVEHCINCHKGMGDSDFTYRTYVAGAKQPARSSGIRYR